MARFSGLSGLCMATTTMFIVLMINMAAAQTVHVVGDNLGWTVPQGGAQAYATWATDKTFAVGDILSFEFQTNNHDVLQVQSSSFDACTSSDAVGSVVTTGPANVTLDTPGDHYYICTIGRHCAAGQKLAITVASAPGGGPTTTTPPPSTPTNSNVPPPVSACAPTPDAAGPTAMSPPPPPVGSSSSRASLSILAVAPAPLLLIICFAII